MQVFIDFFSAIGDAIISFFEFVIGFFSDIVYIIELTAIFLAQIPNYFSWLPSNMLSMVVLIFGIVVLYKIFGREG